MLSEQIFSRYLVSVKVIIKSRILSRRRIRFSFSEKASSEKISKRSTFTRESNLLLMKNNAISPFFELSWLNISLIRLTAIITMCSLEVLIRKGSNKLGRMKNPPEERNCLLNIMFTLIS
jgi:hypothetical protein